MFVVNDPAPGYEEMKNGVLIEFLACPNFA
jgi:hypothetical protein